MHGKGPNDILKASVKRSVDMAISKEKLQVQYNVQLFWLSQSSTINSFDINTCESDVRVMSENTLPVP